MAQTKDIAEILRKRDPEKYKAIIERAELNGYHDFKFDKIPGHPEYGDIACPKVQLVHDLGQFPELADIRNQVMSGDFDEKPDAQDNLDLRLELLNDNSSDAMFKMMGLEPPTYAERFLHNQKKKSN